LPAENDNGVCDSLELVFFASEQICYPYSCWDKGLSWCFR